MSPQQPPAPEFETSVLDEFRARLLEFCSEQHSGPRVDFDRLDVVVNVVTAFPVPGLRDVLSPYARRVLTNELGGAHLDRVVFAVNEQLPRPWHRVTVSGSVQSPPPPPPPAGEPGSPLLRLTLAYGGDHRYVFPLAAADAWLAIRRGPAAQDQRLELPLPDHLIAVPAGALLYLRYWQGGVELHRAAVRTEYTVHVGDRILPPGEQVRLARAGEIAYAIGDRRTVLTYLLTERA